VSSYAVLLTFPRLSSLTCIAQYRFVPSYPVAIPVAILPPSVCCPRCLGQGRTSDLPNGAEEPIGGPRLENRRHAAAGQPCWRCRPTTAGLFSYKAAVPCPTSTFRGKDKPSSRPGGAQWASSFLHLVQGWLRRETVTQVSACSAEKGAAGLTHCQAGAPTHVSPGAAQHATPSVWALKKLRSPFSRDG
jgi:hypothetical protein